ncbi:MAG: signal recognition particle-docking protein FtsY [Candidatus Hydrothermarchaeaceae archaeon]
MFSLLKDRVRGLADRIKGEVLLSEGKLEEALWDFKVTLLESDVALEVSEKITDDLKANLMGKKVERTGVLSLINESLKESLGEILLQPPDIVELAGQKKPFIMAFVGVNGTGKTTTIAKVAHLLRKNGLSCVMAASDTYRAGGIEQLEEHARRLKVPVIKHAGGADAAAVAYDAVEHAKARGLDVVLIDTAGRTETNVNLLDEMRKIVRVAKPDLTVFVGDSLTGNAAVEQAQRFGRAVHLDGVILTKADADAKGGSAISISYVLKCPILFLGTGQDYEDLVEFSPDFLVSEILPE